MSSCSVMGYPAGRCDELWSCFAATDETDEAVFSILNLDHERFLKELDEKEVESPSALEDAPNLISSSFDFYQPFGNYLAHLVPSPEHVVPRLEEQSSQEGDGFASPETTSRSQDYSQLRQLDHRTCSKIQRLKTRISADISCAQSCSILRANISALRRLKPTRDPAAVPNCAATRAALVLQSAWRGFVFRHVFLHLREIIAKFSVRYSEMSATPRPPTPALAPTGPDCCRLAADPGSYLPVVVYKVFTRRPVIDVCRGCCGRLLCCRTAPKPGSAPAAPAGLPYTRGCADCHMGSVCCMLFSSYKRVENNNWRLCHVGLFDPHRCPARGRARRSSGSLPARTGTSGASRQQGARKTPVHDKERLAKITRLRRLYGYDRGDSEARCPPPPPTAHFPQSRPPAEGEDGDDDVCTETRSEPTCPLEEAKRCSTPRIEDVYYDHLLAAWGL